jgi:hypothetical protein
MQMSCISYLRRSLQAIVCDLNYSIVRGLYLPPNGAATGLLLFRIQESSPKKTVIGCGFQVLTPQVRVLKLVLFKIPSGFPDN